MAGSAGHAYPREGSLGAIFTPVEPVALNKPAYGAGIPPNESHGEPFWSACSCMFAWSGLAGVGLLPPSMNTRPERSFAPGFPLKSHVAYAVVMDPPSEWPPRTTLPPCFLADSTTRRMSWISTFMPQSRAYATSLSGMN